ncbi:MAG TPA: hypothetical protein VGF27_07595 [Pseudoduganella sp.]
MTAAFFQVALTGLKEGHAAQDVAPRLARMFTQPPEKMLAILDGKRRVLKNGLSEADARKYEAALHSAGCTCAITTSAPAGSASPTSPAVGPAAAPHSAPATPGTAAPRSASGDDSGATAPRSASAAVGDAAPDSAPGDNSAARATATSAAHSEPESPPARHSRDIVTATSTALAALASRAEQHRAEQAQRAHADLASGQKLVVDAVILHGIYFVLQKHLGLVPSLLALLLIATVMATAALRLCRGLGYQARSRNLLMISAMIPAAGLITLALLTRQAVKPLSNNE